MNEQYSIDELITLFADGELSEENERRLFEIISADPLCHEEFRKALSIQKLMSEVHFPVPSADLDAAVFEKAGFTKEKKRRPVIFFWDSSSAKIFTAAATILLIFGVVFYNTNRVDNTALLTVHEQRIGSEKSQGLVSENNTVPSLNNTDNLSSGNIKSTVFGNETESKIRHQDYKNVSRKNTTEHKNDYNKGEQPVFANNNVITPEPINNSNTEEKVHNSIAENKLPLSKNQDKKLDAFEENPIKPIGLKTMKSKFFVEARGGMMLNSSNQQNTNVSFAGMMKLSETTWLGVAAGRENLMGGVANTTPNTNSNSVGEFSNTSTDGKSANRDQPNQTESIIPPVQNWFGAVVERRFGELFAGAEPTARMVVGGTGIGPFAKVGAGMMLHFNGSVHASVGFENTGIMYKKNNNWEVSNMIGAVCSFALEF